MRLTGVIAAVPTPFDAAGQPERALFEAHCGALLAGGCDGLNVLGSTGEANSLPHRARLAVMAWALHAGPAARLMVGTGTPSLVETVALTEAADDLGYRTALVLPPYYYKPLTETGLIGWYTALHEALGARKIEISFYNYPQLTGVPLPIAVIAALAERFPARFTGLKDSSGDLAWCRDLLEAVPALAVFPSSETSLAEAHDAGFAGCISATANLTAGLAQRVWNGEIKDASELARQRATITGQPLIASIKYLLARKYAQPQWERVLPPFAPLSAAQKAALDTDLPRAATL